MYLCIVGVVCVITCLLFIVKFGSRVRRSLHGSVCLVTGGASGIGEALTEVLLSRGSVVEVWDVSESNISRAKDKHKDVIYRRVDVSNIEEVEKSARDLIAHHGGIDILINNAGISNPFDIEESTITELEQTINTNFMSHIWTIRTFLPDLRKSRRVNGLTGSVVAISSVLGQVGTGGLQAYCSSKSAVIGLMESLYMQHEDIHWCIVCPYITDTDLFKGMGHRFTNYFYKMLNKHDLAEQVVSGIENQSSFINVPYLWNWAFVVIKNIFPLPVMRQIEEFFGVRMGYLKHADRLRQREKCKTT